MKIYDCFIFNHELDLLEMRLEILNDYVDYFVLTESNKTFSGKDKPLHFLENYKRFDKWKNKIIYNKIDMLDFSTSWQREIYSRNMSIVATNYDDEDIILTSDLDEIPNPELILNLRNESMPDNCHITFKQKCYVYYLNNFDPSNWYGTRVAKYKYLKNTTIDDIRESTEDESRISGPIFLNGGWHFTSCGDSDYIKNKISSYSHTEYDNSYILDNVENNLKNNQDVFFRNKNYILMEIDESFPKQILQNQEKYSHIIGRKNVNNT